MRERAEEALRWHDAEARRSPASRPMRVAFTESASPELDHQDMVGGRIERGDAGDENTGTGVGLDEFARLGIDMYFLPDIHQDGMAILRDALAAGDAVFVTIGTRAEGVRVGGDPLLALPRKVHLLEDDDEEGRGQG